MKVADQAALKAYLQENLRALSDADPDVLADYILALLKHERPNMEEWLVSQLADFLHDHTRPFAQRLLRHIIEPVVSVDGGSSGNSGNGRVMGDGRDGREREQERTREEYHARERRRSRSPRRDRYERVERVDRRERMERVDRPERPERLERLERQERQERTDKQEKYDRPERTDKYDRQDRRKRGNHETRLVVDRIPQPFCTVDAVTDYFKRFGRLTQVSVQQDRAVIEYESKEEAQRALSCPDAMFGNRFVRLYPDHRDDQPPIQLPKVTTYTAPNYKPPTTSVVNSVATTNSRLLELNKQKQDLLNAYLEQQRMLLQRLESPDDFIDDDTKHAIMTSIKSLDEKIGAISVGTSRPSPEPSFPTTAASASTQPVTQNQSRKLDLRPTTIKISPVPEKLADGNVPVATVLFGTFGAVKSVDFCADSLLVTYSNRQDAEKANLGEIQVEWHVARPVTPVFDTTAASSAE